MPTTTPLITTHARKPAGWLIALRWLHAALVILITPQIAIGLLMDPPRFSRLNPGAFTLAFRAHMYMGLCIAAVALAHWLYSLTRGRADLRHLFPWNPMDFAVIGDEILALLRGRPAPGGVDAKLAGFVHGLGLLAATGMGTTGTVMFALIMSGHYHWSGFEPLLDTHDTLAFILIAYWSGHVLMALWHEMRGERVLAGIFRLTSR